jgi:hypothetical protein
LSSPNDAVGKAVLSGSENGSVAYIDKISDRPQLPRTFDLSLSESAASRSSHGPGRPCADLKTFKDVLQLAIPSNLDRLHYPTTQNIELRPSKWRTVDEILAAEYFLEPGGGGLQRNRENVSVRSVATETISSFHS